MNFFEYPSFLYKALVKSAAPQIAYEACKQLMSDPKQVQTLTIEGSSVDYVCLPDKVNPKFLFVQLKDTINIVPVLPDDDILDLVEHETNPYSFRSLYKLSNIELTYNECFARNDRFTQLAMQKMTNNIAVISVNNKVKDVIGDFSEVEKLMSTVVITRGQCLSTIEDLLMHTTFLQTVSEYSAELCNSQALQSFSKDVYTSATNEYTHGEWHKRTPVLFEQFSQLFTHTASLDQTLFFNDLDSCVEQLCEDIVYMDDQTHTYIVHKKEDTFDVYSVIREFNDELLLQDLAIEHDFNNDFMQSHKCLSISEQEVSLVGAGMYALGFVLPCALERLDEYLNDSGLEP